jgi:hypothetical protein
MKKSELKQLIKEEIQKVLKENIGIYISDAYLGIIIKSLQKSKLVDQNIIEDLINKKDVAKNILLNKKAIYKSLQINGKTLGLNEEAFNMLLNKISDLNSGKATFVDYILNEGFQGDEPEGDGLSGFRGAGQIDRGDGMSGFRGDIEGSIKGHINDVIDELNNLPFTGSAYKKGNEIHYYLDDSNVDKEARSVKKLANSIGWKLKEDNDDILIFTLK